MEPVDGFDTAEEVKLIEEGILLPFWVVLVKLGDSESEQWGCGLIRQGIVQVSRTFLLCGRRYLSFDIVVSGES
jgi:hypothetical protein